MTTNFQDRIRALQHAEHAVTPDAAWVKQTRGVLASQVAKDLKRSSILPGRSTVKSAAGSFAVFIQRPAMVLASVLALIAGTSIASVEAAQRALPGNVLYSLKLVSEQARLAIAPKNQKLALKSQITADHVSDLQQVASQGDDQHVAQVAVLLQQDLDTLKQQLGDVASTSDVHAAADAATLVSKNSNQVISALQAAKTNLSPSTKASVTQAQLAAADLGVSAIQVLAEKNKESNSVVPTSTVTQALEDDAKAVSGATSTTIPVPMLGDASGSAAVSTSTAKGKDASASSTVELGTTASTSLPDIVTQVGDATIQALQHESVLDVSASDTASSVAGAATSSTTSSTQDTSTSTPK